MKLCTQEGCEQWVYGAALDCYYHAKLRAEALEAGGPAGPIDNGGPSGCQVCEAPISQPVGKRRRWTCSPACQKARQRKVPSLVRLKIEKDRLAPEVLWAGRMASSDGGGPKEHVDHDPSETLRGDLRESKLTGDDWRRLAEKKLRAAA